MDEIKDYYERNDWLRLKGYQSTSESIDVASSFMLKGLKINDYPVLFHIKGIIDDSYFALDNDEYSFFDYEKELLFNDGLLFEITLIDEKI